MAVLALLISILALDITPTIVLFFVFPTDTFSLLAIHIALFYTEVMVGTVFVRWLKCQSVKEWCQSVKEWCQSAKEWHQSVKERWQSVYKSIKEKCKSRAPVSSSEVGLHQYSYNDEILLLPSQDTGPGYGTRSIVNLRQRHTGDQGERNGDQGGHNSDQGEHNGDQGEHNGDQGERNGDQGERNGDQGKQNQAEHNGDQGRCNGCKALICIIIVQVLSIVACVLVYFPAIYFFQFLILRNTNNGAFDILIKYIPSIAIVFFGIFIRKKILQDKDDKDAN